MSGIPRLAGRVPTSQIIKEIRIGDQNYSPQFFNDVYHELLKPKSKEFYSSPNLHGSVTAGNVVITRNLGEYGWSVSSPKELVEDIESEGYYQSEKARKLLAIPPVDRELRNVARSFKEVLRSPEGGGVYLNTPMGGLEGKRARLYRTMGFENNTETGKQILDNRNPVNTGQQSLLAVGDQLYLSPHQRQLSETSRLKRNLPIYEVPPAQVNGMALEQYLEMARQA